MIKDLLNLKEAERCVVKKNCLKVLYLIILHESFFTSNFNIFYNFFLNRENLMSRKRVVAKISMREN